MDEPMQEPVKRRTAGRETGFADICTIVYGAGRHHHQQLDASAPRRKVRQGNTEAVIALFRAGAER